jgi:hypothetical protein
VFINEQKKQKNSISRARKGIIFSDKTKRKMSMAKIGVKHPKWIGNDISNLSMASLHYRFKKENGKADHCSNIECSGKSTKYQWSRKDHNKNTLNIEDWQQLCASCHRKYDNEFNRSNNKENHITT